MKVELVRPASANWRLCPRKPHCRPISSSMLRARISANMTVSATMRARHFYSPGKVLPGITALCPSWTRCGFTGKVYVNL